jgi:hypothetical protein
MKLQASRTLCLLAAVLSISSPAEAYLDPGTGSMLVSAVIGAAAAIALAVRMFWYQLVAWFRGRRRAGEGSPRSDA